MDREAISDETARALRTTWFDYVDTVEPLRAPLHAYGVRLTGSVWDAEDLVQDTLLKGFAMIGRGDLHGPGSPVANPRAYLFRTATNLWLDGERRRARERAILADEPVLEPAATAPEAVRAAGERLFLETAPQERAAVILKDVFDFSLEEIADQLRTTLGGAKSALHRGRTALKSAAEPRSSGARGPSRDLVDRFIDAFHARDVARITATLTEACSIEVPGVGGGRGRRGGWAEASVAHGGVRLQAATYRGETVVLAFHAGADGAEALHDVMRLEEADCLVSRLINYCFCPDTLRLVGAELGLAVEPWGYHQPPEVLPRMIATTTLPWGEGMRLH